MLLSALYLDNCKHFRQGILGGRHGWQQAEEVVSRCIREHLQIVGRVLRAHTWVSAMHTLCTLHSRGPLRINRCSSAFSKAKRGSGAQQSAFLSLWQAKTPQWLTGLNLLSCPLGFNTKATEQSHLTLFISQLRKFLQRKGCLLFQESTLLMKML